jgi:hypothetical protein
MRMMDLANSVLALAEPEPLTLANLTTKSLTARELLLHVVCDQAARAPARLACSRVRMFHLQVFLHVPGARRAALGTQAAMQADVLVLDHDALGLQPGPET